MPVYPSGGTIAQSVGSPGFGPAPTPSYNASASVRLNPADTANISFNPTIEGSRTTWTLAFWAKRSLLATRQFLVSNYNSATTIGFVMEFDASDRLDIYDFTSPTYSPRLITTQVFRDVGAWYHFTVVLDTSQATNTDRFKLFVNGVQVTAFSTATYPAQFYQGNWNRVGYQSTFGKAGVYTSGTLYLYGGYFADMNFVDGLALTPSSFTSTDANTGQLVPIQYTGSFGINGCYLPFSSAALAADLGQNPKTTAQDYPYWPYSTLLVNTTSTNGAQNNTFLDSSTNNFTITRNGNTTQGNFTPFNYGGGTTQANGYYSGYFDGTGDYLNQATNRFLDGSTWTVEGWVYTSDTTATIAAQYVASGGQFSSRTILGISSGLIYIFQAGSSASGTTNISNNQWYHIAYVRNGSTVKAYVNGRLEATFSGFINPSLTTTTFFYDGFNSGQEFFGYFSNLRVTTTEVYASNFTPPTSPLTAITGTALLTCQSSQFIDNSANAFTITVNGNPQPTVVNPFGMTNWSGYFDGTGDYLNFNGTTFNVGTGSFTLEGWVYITAYTFSSVISTWNSTTAPVGFVLGLDSSGRPFFSIGTASGAGSSDITGTSAIPLNTWVHLAATKTAGSGGTMTLYANGISVGTNTTTRSVVNTAAVIGRYYQDTNNYYINGAISNVRVVTGSVVYTSNFTPPTAPLTAISGTQLLTCQSSTFIDNSPNAFAITVNGNSYTGTLNNPFNSPINYTTPPVQAWSNYFDGTGDYLSTTVSAAQVGTGDFTIEFFCYLPQALDANDTLLSHGYAAAAFTNGWYLQSNGTRLSFGIGNAGGGSAVASNTDTPVRRWFHFAITRFGSLLRVWQDGLLTGSMTNAQNGTATNFFTIASASTNYYCTCNISNLRIIKGRSIYNANFTVPTSPLTAVQNTSLLTCQSNTFVDNSITNATVTKNGDALISSNSPFFPTQAWSAASYGGTMYFDGTGDYLTAPSDTSTTLDGNFTIEYWMYRPAAGNNWMFTLGDAFLSSGIETYIGTSGTVFNLWVSGANRVTSSTLPAVGAWSHVAVVRSGSTITLYLNGNSLGTYSSSTTFSGITYIGAERYNGSITGAYTGYLSCFRILKGTALYTTPFLPPVLPPTAIANTSLLLNATNSGIYDATGNNAIETVGNAQVSTAVKKWGTSSVYFDGNGDYLQSPNSNQFNFGPSDFTIEFWMYASSQALAPIVHQTSYASSQGWVVWNYDGANVGTSTRRLTFMLNGASFSLTTSSDAYANNTWTHIAVVKLGTASNNIKIYSNGVSIASGTYATAVTNATTPFFIGGIINGVSWNGTAYYSGYLQDVRITKGVGRYSGNFTPPAAAFAYNQYDIGNQQWLPNNLSVTAGINQDNLVDSPSDYGTDTGLGGQVRGNYATLNPLDNGGLALSNGNLDANRNSASWLSVRATIQGITSGKWYWECTTPTSVSGSNYPIVGVAWNSQVLTNYVGSDFYGYGCSFFSGQKFNNGVNTNYGTAFATNDIMGVAFDADNGKIWFSKNGTWFASGDPVAGTNAAYTGITGQIYAPTFSVYGTNSTVVVNFGQRAFSYAAPTGFKCLVSGNITTVNSIGATSSTQATDYINPLIYTGNDVSGRTITGVGFQPDLVWIKARNQAYSNQVTDVVRGPSKALLTNSTSAELPNRTVGYVSAFASDGFTVTAGSTDSAEVNQSGTTYVAWNWKANGAGVANTAGTIPSTVSANTTSGCSIITYTGNASSSQTIGHGLGVAPKFVIIKERTGTWAWMVYHEKLTANNYLILNGSQAQVSNSQVYNAAPTSTVINIGNNATVNNNGSSFVAYAFAPISGFSATGSYTGNGSSTQGAFVYTGFRPAFVMIKAMTSAYSWVIYDDARNPSNLTNLILIPDSSGAEITGVGTVIDMVSNGFIPRNAGNEVNASSVTYVYIAFAEFPFKYSRAR